MYSSWLFLLQTAKLGPVLSGPEIIPHKSTIDDVHLRLLQRKQSPLKKTYTHTHTFVCMYSLPPVRTEDPGARTTGNWLWLKDTIETGRHIQVLWRRHKPPSTPSYMLSFYNHNPAPQSLATTIFFNFKPGKGVQSFNPSTQEAGGWLSSRPAWCT